MHLMLPPSAKDIHRLNVEIINFQKGCPLLKGATVLKTARYLRPYVNDSPPAVLKHISGGRDSVKCRNLS